MATAKARRSAKTRALHPIDPAEESQVLPHRQVFVERELLRHVADDLAHLFGIARDVEARDFRSSAARPEEAAEDADRRRFPRAVGSEEAHDFAAPRLEAHVVDGDEIAEALDEPVGADADLADVAVHSASSVRSETNRSSIEGAMRSISSTGTLAAASAP